MGFNGTDGVNGTQGPRGFNGTDGVNGTQGPRGFNGTDGVNGTNGVNGTQGSPGPNQIPSTKLYSNVSDTVSTFPVNSSLGFAVSDAFCLPGDVAISGGPIIRPQNANSYPGSGAPPESLSGSYLSGFTSFSTPPFNLWITEARGNNLLLATFVLCFDN